ncbi:hypothetical protein SERLA73DRAFT_188587 [Serpula lacrymans var. lacrymans S7.3]|uniref:Oxidoreductase n=2 Tax=Serpula lacrymans var. lacrymans TaxID=341189 RepID=F8QBM4_SERL3|nr:uncharacterized protein SERLADRAFT_478748 [Serpula lacrymans var. lacrymans S7.9]EGN94610.1 hypothetical protein SERLA73DRAFT_188587 [Serpula lacrymans var. lacrymans S7.3]EGO20088.1 hypothetical protein SERLADRAFT_478748 [Serpula lacrymans var. lacrymans S7.9]
MALDSKKLERQKVVLVTGCSKGGIGFNLCERFAGQGCIVYATARRLETMDDFSDPTIHKLVLDVTNESNIQDVVKTILDDTGRIDVLVNNAGGISIGPLLDVSMDQARKTFEVNTYAPLQVAKAVLPSMVERRSGLVVNIGSVVGEIPTPWNGLYCASKAALHSISDVLAMECGPFNVKVMLVAPGGVKSNISSNQAATYNMPLDSLYKPYIDKIIARMNISQSKGALDTDEFAKTVVSKILSPSPPTYYSLGKNTVRISFLKWLPRALALWLTWRSIGKI